MFIYIFKMLPKSNQSSHVATKKTIMSANEIKGSMGYKVKVLSKDCI
jgi:hypothetical protein